MCCLYLAHVRVQITDNGRDAEMIALTLPWPVSANRNWRHVGNRTLLSSEARKYRARVVAQVRGMALQTLTGRLVVSIDAFPPDRRRRDLSNTLKVLEDALTHAGLWLDDEQIDDLRIIRRRPEAPGAVVVRVSEMGAT